MLPHRFLGTFVLACAVFPAVLLATPPANNNFDDAIIDPFSELSVGVPNSDYNNTDATLEAGESVPAGFTSTSYQGSVWYYWTNPSDSDWFEVDTSGSSFNTVLAVWSALNPLSPAVNSLKLVHVNDEALGSSNVSRLRFFAQSGETYYFSVAGRNSSARGNVQITLGLAFNLLISTISSLAFSPASPNVTSAAVNVTTTLTMPTTADISTGTLRIFGPSRNLITSTPLSIANRTNGTNAPGNYTVSFTLPRYLAPGSYYWSLNCTDNTALRLGSVGWEQLEPVPNGITASFTVQNTGAVDTYSQWLAQNGMSGTGSLQTDDPDHDGVLNLQEFGFGLNPQSPSNQTVTTSGGAITRFGLPSITTVGSDNTLRLRVEFVRRVSDPAISYNVRFGDDLSGWSNAVNAPVVIATGSGYEVVAVEDQAFDPVKGTRFAHVQITYSLP